jgi:hypothetical protein
VATAAATAARPRARAAILRRAPDAVVEWRFDELERAGFDAVWALALALATEVELGSARELLARGCPPATAVQILL